MFPDELVAALARRPLVYLTYGLCEPHGLHNAVGLDALKAHALACRAAQAHGGLVAPPFFWHVHEIGYHALWGARTIGDRNPWLTSLPPWVFFQMFFYHLRAAAARGFHAAIVITGHYGGNERDFKRLAKIFMRHSHRCDRRRGRSGLPRPGRPATDARLGYHAERRLHQ